MTTGALTADVVALCAAERDRSFDLIVRKLVAVDQAQTLRKRALLLTIVGLTRCVEAEQLGVSRPLPGRRPGDGGLRSGDPAVQRGQLI